MTNLLKVEKLLKLLEKFKFFLLKGFKRRRAVILSLKLSKKTKDFRKIALKGKFLNLWLQIDSK